MGLFDRIWAPCAHCGERIEFQSKGAEAPWQRDFTLENAPAGALLDVMNDPHHCANCGKWTVLHNPAFPPEFILRLRVAPRQVRDPNPDEFRTSPGPSEYTWWTAPFTFDDMLPAPNVARPPKPVLP